MLSFKSKGNDGKSKRAQRRREAGSGETGSASSLKIVPELPAEHQSGKRVIGQ